MRENKLETTNSARRRAHYAPSLAEDGRSCMCRLNTKIGFIPLVLRNSKSKLHITNYATLQNLIEHPFIKANANINLTHITAVLETLRGFLHSHITLKHGNDLTLCKTTFNTNYPLLQFLILSYQVIQNHFIFSSKFISNRYTNERTNLRQGSLNGQTRDLDFASSSKGTDPQTILLFGNNEYDTNQLQRDREPPYYDSHYLSKSQQRHTHSHSFHSSIYLSTSCANGAILPQSTFNSISSMSRLKQLDSSPIDQKERIFSPLHSLGNMSLL